MAEVNKILYIVIVDGETNNKTEKKDENTGKDSFRYTRSVLQSTLQLMGCKARHAFKVTFAVISSFLIFAFYYYFFLNFKCAIIDIPFCPQFTRFNVKINCSTDTHFLLICSAIVNGVNLVRPVNLASEDISYGESNGSLTFIVSDSACIM